MPMDRDFRKLEPAVQAELRRRAVAMVDAGRTRQESGFGCRHQPTVCRQNGSMRATNWAMRRLMVANAVAGPASNGSAGKGC
jgi:hypothetical protein